ncbi:MAG: hypothetical protein H7A25_22335 [Leptospiraceae bacterium]|nr:hypothetical protein [Leptospiraceae bacterium]MCP5502653.1 hypothetical protein [Leptospiraceae bacterium]
MRKPRVRTINQLEGYRVLGKGAKATLKNLASRLEYMITGRVQNYRDDRLLTAIIESWVIQAPITYFNSDLSLQVTILPQNYFKQLELFKKAI